ncbi:MAG: TRAP transporter large permease subunit [Candidatus Eremiobacteraeota bacterium]|nr:TRAP transporter large permease subunit [Candidatus Eremiobacteraeota bacterium]
MAVGEIDPVAATEAAEGLERPPSGLWRPWTRAIDRAIGAVVEPIAAVILVVEVAILASGVFSRYVLHNAIVWTDELATILFLWLAMLGAVIAYRRREHMRLTALYRRRPARQQQIFDAIAAFVVAAFAIELMPASYRFLLQETIDLTPALNIPRSYVVAAIIVALILILIMSLLRLIDADPKISVPVVGVAIVISVIAVLLHPFLAPLGNFNLVLFFVVLVGALITIGVPIGFAFGFATLSYLALTTTVPLNTVVGRMDEGVSNLVLLAVPLFVLLGLLMEIAGIASRLVNAIAALIGHVRGGLGIVLLGAMYLVSGISGSKAADMAAIAPVLFPEMERRGQKRAEMISLLSASGAMSETIPPSLVLIIIGSVTGVSIAALFTAGLLPAAICALTLVFVVLWRSKDDKVELAARPSLPAIVKAIVIAIPGLLLPLVIRAFVLGGVATATEVSTVGIIYTILVGVLIYREFPLSRIYPCLRETCALTGAIMLIIATATSMGWSLTQSGFAQQLADSLKAAPGGAAGFMALSIVLFTVLGSVLEGIPAMVLFGPLLFPIAKQFGVNDVHYAIVAIIAMGIGLFAPPLGVGYYGACAIGKASPDEAAIRVIPYLGAVLLGLILIAYVPWLSTGFLGKQPGQ